MSLLSSEKPRTDYIDNVRTGTYKNQEFLEYAPQVRLIQFKINGVRRVVRLQFQYVQIWKCGKTYVGCTWTKTPLIDEEVTVYHMPLPHVTDGLVCLGTEHYTKPLAVRMQSFWVSPFVIPYHAGYKLSVAQLDEWEKTGKMPVENPMTLTFLLHHLKMSSM